MYKETMTARFENGKTIVMPKNDVIKNRLDFYNWICINRLNEFGELLEIEE